jgi:hypothetical protein|nr:hypothetical protein [Kofleriaceae bacterium]
MQVRLAALIVAGAGATAACGPTPAARLDSSTAGDGAVEHGDSPDTPYSHTILLDGSDDFSAGEVFTTTTPGFGADVTWDDTNIYVGYSGTDLSTGTQDAASKWLFVFVDADPGNGTGAATSLAYNTQHATFPPGFGADYYLRWKCDGTFTTIEQADSSQQTGWSTTNQTVQFGQAGEYLEVAFPRSLLGGATSAGVLAFMINEGDNVESSFGGLYAGNFVDGYAADLVTTRYLRADFTSSLSPNNPDNEAPPQDTGSGGGGSD